MATFKVKNEVGTDKITKTSMLGGEEIRLLCEKHNLSRGQIYDIRSTFGSMC
jgi:hypothetical protein